MVHAVTAKTEIAVKPIVYVSFIAAVLMMFDLASKQVARDIYAPCVVQINVISI